MPPPLCCTWGRCWALGITPPRQDANLCHARQRARGLCLQQGALTHCPGCRKVAAGPGAHKSPPKHGVKLAASQDLGFNNWQPPGEPPALGDCRASRKGHLAQLFIVQQRHVQPFPKIPRAQLWELHLIREIQINSFPIFFFPFFFSPQTMKETDGS